MYNLRNQVQNQVRAEVRDEVWDEVGKQGLWQVQNQGWEQINE